MSQLSRELRSKSLTILENLASLSSFSRWAEEVELSNNSQVRETKNCVKIQFQIQIERTHTRHSRPLYERLHLNFNDSMVDCFRSESSWISCRFDFLVCLGFFYEFLCYEIFWDFGEWKWNLRLTRDSTMIILVVLCSVVPLSCSMLVSYSEILCVPIAFFVRLSCSNSGLDPFISWCMMLIV